MLSDLSRLGEARTLGSATARPAAIMPAEIDMCPGKKLSFNFLQSMSE